MSSSRQMLVAAYDHSLEQQIVGRGSNLACRDEELWNKMEGLLKDGNAQETHCLGLDPLRVMEESLMEAAAAAPAPNGGQGKARRGLQSLAKVFEVLEQAALNLYLGPWRKEYRVVKMYSGMFTHYIKPVLSMPQIKKVFGLLGYQPSLSRQEQLCLQSRTNPNSLDNLLRLSCAFFLARCECRLLAMALGSHVGEAEWELNVVRERKMGHSVQVALENTMKTLKSNQSVMEQIDTELDEDLYTDKQDIRGQREAVVIDDEGPRSLTWVTQSSASPQALKALNNEVTSLPPSVSLTTREHTCISTLNCQLTKTSPAESDTPRSSSANKRQGRRHCEESTFDKADPSLQSLSKREAEANQLCSCPQSPHLFPNHCVQCETFNNFSGALLSHCIMEDHNVPTSDGTNEALNGSGSELQQSERVNHVSAEQNSSGVMSSLPLCDGPKSIMPSCQPIVYHECCNLAQLDPRVLCVSCCVFHSGSCRERDYCQIHHTVKKLGVCECGKVCSRKPLVLCRYCGNEYCSDCWYRSPLVCKCGQAFDQSSSV